MKSWGGLASFLYHDPTFPLAGHSPASPRLTWKCALTQSRSLKTRSNSNHNYAKGFTKAICSDSWVSLTAWHTPKCGNEDETDGVIRTEEILHA